MSGARHSPAPRLRWLARADERRPVPSYAVARAELFTTLYLLAVANALAGAMLPALRGDEVHQPLSDVLNLGTLAAIAVGVYLLRQTPDAPVAACDWIAAAMIAPLLLVPHHSASWLAVICLALHAIARDRRSETAGAAASVFLLLAVSSYWGPILGQALGPSLLVVDAALAATLLSLLAGSPVDRVGNMIIAGDQTTLVMFWCSFLPNLFHGLLWYAIIARAVRPAWHSTDLLALLAVGGLVLTVNTLRLALMGLDARTYEWVHGQIGGDVFNLGLLLVIAAIALYSAAPAAAAVRRQRGAARRGELDR